MKISPYKILSAWNDGKAIAKGPDAIVKRVIRKNAYRNTNKITRKLLRKMGL